MSRVLFLQKYLIFFKTTIPSRLITFTYTSLPFLPFLFFFVTSLSLVDLWTNSTFRVLACHFSSFLLLWIVLRIADWKMQLSRIWGLGIVQWALCFVVLDCHRSQNFYELFQRAESSTARNVLSYFSYCINSTLGWLRFKIWYPLFFLAIYFVHWNWRNQINWYFEWILCWYFPECFPSNNSQ